MMHGFDMVKSKLEAKTIYILLSNNEPLFLLCEYHDTVLYQSNQTIFIAVIHDTQNTMYYRSLISNRYL